MWQSFPQTIPTTGAVLELGAYGGWIRLRAALLQRGRRRPGGRSAGHGAETLVSRGSLMRAWRGAGHTAGVASWILTRRHACPLAKTSREESAGIPGTTASSMCGTAKRRIQNCKSEARPSRPLSFHLCMPGAVAGALPRPMAGSRGAGGGRVMARAHCDPQRDGQSKRSSVHRDCKEIQGAAQASSDATGGLL